MTLGFVAAGRPAKFEKFTFTYSSASSRVSNVFASVITPDHDSPVQTARLSEGRIFGARLVGASVAQRSELITKSLPCLRVKIPIAVSFLVVANKRGRARSWHDPSVENPTLAIDESVRPADGQQIG
jgi:hypothetical protein